MEQVFNKFLTKGPKKEGFFIKVRGVKYSIETLPEYLYAQKICEIADVNRASLYIFDKLQEEHTVKDGFDIEEWIRNKIKSKRLTCNFNGTWLINGVSADAKLLISQIQLELNLKGIKIANNLIEASLYCWEVEQVNSYIDRLKQKVCFKSETKELGAEILRDYVRCVSLDDKERREIHIKVLQHVIWCVKRKIWGKEVEHHLLVNFYGETRAGKSQALERLLRPIKDVVYPSGTLKMFSESREMFLLQKYFVILLEELEGGNRADVNALKRLITSDDVSYRMLGFNKEMNGPNKATFIGTANNRIKDTIFDPTSAGRFFEINCHPKVEFKANWEEINNLNYLTIWQSVDEDAPSPILDVIDEVHTIQNREFKAMTMFECWMDDMLVEPAALDDDEGQWITADKIKREYEAQDFSEGAKEYKVSKAVLGREMTRLGFLTRREVTQYGKITEYRLKQPKLLLCKRMTKGEF